MRINYLITIKRIIKYEASCSSNMRIIDEDILKILKYCISRLFKLNN